MKAMGMEGTDIFKYLKSLNGEDRKDVKLGYSITFNPLQVLDDNLCIAWAISSDARSDVYGVDGDHNTEMKQVKRHSGQQSRIRKLQYIAELEKTVEVFQLLKQN